MISNDCPVWKALLWKKKWDKIKVEMHSDLFEYKIISVK
jgi:transcription elongation GreA/GreB family factor